MFPSTSSTLFILFFIKFAFIHLEILFNVITNFPFWARKKELYVKIHFINVKPHPFKSSVLFPSAFYIEDLGCLNLFLQNFIVGLYI